MYGLQMCNINLLQFKIFLLAYINICPKCVSKARASCCFVYFFIIIKINSRYKCKWHLHFFKSNIKFGFNYMIDYFLALLLAGIQQSGKKLYSTACNLGVQCNILFSLHWTKIDLSMKYHFYQFVRLWLRTKIFI